MAERLRKFADDVLRLSGLGTLVFATGGAVLIAALQRYLPEYLPLVMFPAAAFTLVIVIVAAWRVLRESAVTPENIKKRLMQWADLAGHGIGRHDDANAYFSFLIRLPVNHTPVMVARALTDPMFLVFLTDIDVDAESERLLQQMSEADAGRLLLEIGSSLNQMRVDYDGLELPLKRIRVSRTLFIKRNLSIQDYLDSTRDVQHAMQVVIRSFVLRRISISAGNEPEPRSKRRSNRM